MKAKDKGRMNIPPGERRLSMKLPFKVDLTGKTVVVTGAGGVLCSSFSKALAQCILPSAPYLPRRPTCC